MRDVLSVLRIEHNAQRVSTLTNMSMMMVYVKTAMRGVTDALVQQSVTALNAHLVMWSSMMGVTLNALWLNHTLRKVTHASLVIDFALCVI